MKVTTNMAAKWVKAAFMVLLGVVLLFYADGFVNDLETNVSQEWNMSFDWTWTLLTYLIWILVAWLFVNSALTVALSIRADAYTLSDVMDRMKRLEDRLGPPPALRDRASGRDELPAVTVDDEPPPPSE